MTGGAKSTGGGTLTGSAAGGAFRFAPQLLQNDSPAGFTEPQLGQATVPPAAGAGGGMVADMTDAGAASGSPHSSQKAEPSGLSCPCEHLTDISCSLLVFWAVLKNQPALNSYNQGYF
jgi:hypothetical protein